MWIALSIGLLCCYLFYRTWNASAKIIPHGRFVLITGCDSGFGHTLAIRLDEQGFYVLAGVLMEKSIIPLKDKLSANATVFRLDITQQTDIDMVYDLVRAKTNTLHALVNNAGVATGGFIDWSPMVKVRQMMEVNYFGHVAMTKKFLPLLIKKTHSRVVNISSMCGFISLPGSAAYCASKHALESFSDCLRREMKPWKLHVSIIEPGTMRTSMTDIIKKELLDDWAQVPSETQERWGEAFFRRLYEFIMESPFIRYAEDPEKVVRAMEHAISSTQPHIRYRPGWQSNMVLYPLSNLPVALVDQMFALGLGGYPAGLKDQIKDESAS